MTTERFLAKADYEKIREMRAKGILVGIDGHKLDPGSGSILVVCADADRFSDIFSHRTHIMKGAIDNPRIHVLSRNGGALRLVHPDIDMGRINHPASSIALDFLLEIIESIRMKQIFNVALYIHTPCGHAKACDITPEDTLRVLALAKKDVEDATIKLGLADVSVHTYCHIDYCQYENGKMRTYFVDTSKI